MPTIYEQLTNAIREYDASYAPNREDGEEPQAHLSRITRYISRDLPEDGWDGLSEPAKDWHDRAVEASKAEKEITLPDGYPAETRRRRAAIDDPPADETMTRRRRVVIDDEPIAKEPTPWDDIRATILAHNADHPVDRAPKESVDDHVRRIIRYLARTLPEAAFDASPKSVQDWYDDQATLGEKNKAFTPPAGYPTDEAKASTGNGAAPAAEEPRRRGRQPSADGESNATDRIIEYVVKNHDKALDAIKSGMDKDDSGMSDLKASTRAVVAANAFKVIKVAKTAGMWKA